MKHFICLLAGIANGPTSRGGIGGVSREGYSGGKTSKKIEKIRFKAVFALI